MSATVLLMAEAALLKKFYIVERIHLWNSLKTVDGGSLAVDTKSLGFCPVYEDEELAKKEWPGEDIHVVVVSLMQKI